MDAIADRKTIDDLRAHITQLVELRAKLLSKRPDTVPKTLLTSPEDRLRYAKHMAVQAAALAVSDVIAMAAEELCEYEGVVFCHIGESCRDEWLKERRTEYWSRMNANHATIRMPPWPVCDDYKCDCKSSRRRRDFYEEMTALTGLLLD